MASVACYADDPKDIRKLITQYLKKEILLAIMKYVIVSKTVQNDRAISRSEIEKLAIYRRRRERILRMWLQL